MFQHILLPATGEPAPVPGTLIARSVERGDVVAPDTPLMTLSPRAAPQLVVQIDERNLGLLAIGQPALASAEAYPLARFAARVAYINPSVDPQRAAVKVKLDVAEAQPTLREDMTISGDITVAERAGVLILPLSANHDPGGAAWVLRIEGGHARRVPVRLGLRGRTVGVIGTGRIGAAMERILLGIGCKVIRPWAFPICRSPSYSRRPTS